MKVAIDAWTEAAGVADGNVLRPVNRADQVQGERMSEKVVWQLLQPYATAAGAAQPRENVPRRRWGARADPVAPGACVGSNDRTVSRNSAGSGSCAERWDQAEGGGFKQSPQ